MPNNQQQQQATDGGIISFLFSTATTSAANLATLPDRMETWLILNKFVLRAENPDDPDELAKADWGAFRGRIYRLFAINAVFGLLITMYSLVLGTSTDSPRMFMTKYFVGLAAYGTVWVLLILSTLLKVNKWLCVGVLAVSAMFMVVAVNTQLSQLWAVMDMYPNTTFVDAHGTLEKIQVVHSIVGERRLDTPILELEMAARAWALFGFFAGILMLIPFMFLGAISQALTGLVFHAPEYVAHLLGKAFGSEHADQAAQALKDLRRHNQKQFTTMHIWVLGMALMTFPCAVIPNFYGLMFAVLIGVATIITQSSRKGFDVTGHDLSKWVHAATICIVLGSISLYLVYIGWICYQMGPAVYIPCGIIALLLFIFLPFAAKKTGIRAEREERQIGDVDYSPYTVQASGTLDANGRPIHRVAVPQVKKSTRRFLTPGIKKFLFIASILAVMLYFHVFNQIANKFEDFDLEDMSDTGVLFSIIGFVIFGVYILPEVINLFKTKGTSTSAGEGTHHE